MKALLVSVTAVLLAACGNATTPAATVTPTSQAPEVQTMIKWKHEAADEVGATGEALTTLGASMKAYDLPAMRVNCTRLRSSVDKLERTLPSPNPAVNTALQGSIDDFRSLSQLCMTVTPSSTDEVDAMGQLVDSGGKHLTDAFDLMGLNTPGW